MPPPWRTDREGPVHHLLRCQVLPGDAEAADGIARDRLPLGDVGTDGACQATRPSLARWDHCRHHCLARMCAGMTGGLRGAPDVHGASRPGGRAITTWIFEPGHTEAEFRARHMMVTWVRGLF